MKLDTTERLFAGVVAVMAPILVQVFTGSETWKVAGPAAGFAATVYVAGLFHVSAKTAATIGTEVESAIAGALDKALVSAHNDVSTHVQNLHTTTPSGPGTTQSAS